MHSIFMLAGFQTVTWHSGYSCVTIDKEIPFLWTLNVRDPILSNFNSFRVFAISECLFKTDFNIINPFIIVSQVIFFS